jgi:hypothetical protein
MQLTNVMIDDLAVDMLRAPTGKGTLVATMVAARRRYLGPLLEALTGAGLRPHAVEPAAFGLLRLATRVERGPGRGRAAIRAFLGASEGLLVLAADARPLAWRGFVLRPGAETTALLEAAGPLCALSSRYGLDSPPGVLIVHGRPELGGLADAPAWEAMGLRVRHVAEPGLGASAAALGVAAGCHQEEEGFNLARGLRPQPTFASVFPWGQAAIEAGVLAAAASLVGGQVMDVETQVRVVASRVAEHGWLKGKAVADLTKERDDLKARAEMVRLFLGGRMQWVRYTRELAARMPQSMGVTQFDGKNTFVPPGAKGTAVRSLSLQVEARLPPGGTVPAEIDALMENLRGNPLLKSNLPMIRMSALKWGVSRERKGEAVASFSVLCTPQAQAKPAGAAAKGKKPAAKSG